MFTAFRWHHHLRSHLGSGGLVPFACPNSQPGDLRLAGRV